MLEFEPNNKLNVAWYLFAITIVFIFSISLRFWQLGHLNTLVFDEVYYAKFANNYLTGTDFFNSHPPLSQYLIAIGIWIASHFNFSPDTMNYLTGSWLSTISYRWLNALTGSFLPLIVGAIAYQLYPRYSYSLIVTLFAALDGLFLVESRYALNNIYLVTFGLLGQLFFLLSRQGKDKYFFKLTLSGLFFGAAASIKWNGLGFLLGIYLLWFIARLIAYYTKIIKQALPKFFQKIIRLKFHHLFCYLGLIPLITYSLIWLPHLLMNPEDNFWQVHQKIIDFHEKIGDGEDVHPYCSKWYTWPLMLRPIAYFYSRASNTQEIVPSYPPLPPETGQIIYDVHALGNPLLWWLSTLAIIVVIISLLLKILTIIVQQNKLNKYPWLFVYIIVNYLANLLPWIRITRCTFLYHYMSSLVFSWLALAWIVDYYLTNKLPIYRQIGITIILSITFVFIFFLPIYLGLPLSPEEYRLRLWFNNWI